MLVTTMVRVLSVLVSVAVRGVVRIAVRLLMRTRGRNFVRVVRTTLRIAVRTIMRIAVRVRRVVRVLMRTMVRNVDRLEMRHRATELVNLSCDLRGRRSHLQAPPKLPLVGDHSGRCGNKHFQRSILYLLIC